MNKFLIGKETRSYLDKLTLTFKEDKVCRERGFFLQAFPWFPLMYLKDGADMLNRFDFYILINAFVVTGRRNILLS